MYEEYKQQVCNDINSLRELKIKNNRLNVNIDDIGDIGGGKDGGGGSKGSKDNKDGGDIRCKIRRYGNFR